MIDVGPILLTLGSLALAAQPLVKTQFHRAIPPSKQKTPPK